MRIMVPVKQILDPGGLTFRRDKERMFVNREDYVIDPASNAALEAALRIKDGDPPGVQVVALSLGPARVDDALREALALGCDAAFRITFKAIDEGDHGVKARILAAAVEQAGGADLIIAGEASADRGSGQLGPRLAELLGFRQVTGVYALEASEGAVRATRRWGDGASPGRFAQVTAPLPVVVAVATAAFPVRYPHGARIMNAYREWDVTTWGEGELALEPSALQPRLVQRGEGFPPPLETGEVVRGKPDDLAWEAVRALRGLGVVEGGGHGF